MLTKSANKSIAPLRKRLQEMTLRSSRIDGALNMMGERLLEVRANVGQAKARQGLHEEVQRLFELLQERAHQRSVGAFERLLTAILHDVLPTEGSVKLGLSIKDNTPSLDVLLQRPGLEPEDVYEDNGGGVTNIVCAGLRFAALSRTKKNRRFMVLDEPDGWLGEENVTPFVKVLADVSKATHTQTIFISHRPAARFEGVVNLVELVAKADGSPAAHLRQPTANQWESDEQPGIRAIELINVRKHTHTILPLLPGATALIGDVNLGKSTAVVAAMKAVCYGESSNSLVRHGADEAQIILHIEGGKQLKWSRKPGRSPVVVYELHEPGNPEPVMKGRPGRRNEAPDWVQDLMGITKVDDLDIQIGNQKKPVFLLDDTASRRAKILSVGRESGYLPAMMREYEAIKGEDRETIKAGEVEARRLEFRLQAKDDAAQLHTTLGKMEFDLDNIDETAGMADSLDLWLKQAQASALRLDALAPVLSCKPLNAPPALPESTSLAQAIEQLAKTSAVCQALSPMQSFAPIAPAPDLPDSSAILSLGRELSKSAIMLKALMVTPTVADQVVIPEQPSDLLTAISALESAKQAVAGFTVQVAAAEKDLRSLEAENESLLKESEGTCPICSSELGSTTLLMHHSHGHAHA